MDRMELTHSTFLPQEQRLLMTLARQSIQYGLEHDRPLPVPEDLPERLTLKGTSFVTLEIHNQLRGCIGSLKAYRPLIQDVINNAFAAAFQDNRFPPLNISEWPDLNLSISILSPPEPLVVENEAQLLQLLAPYRDGLILQDGHHRSTFLPQVWQQLPDAKQFLQHLKAKAGLPVDYWSPTLTFQRYTVEKISP